MRIKFWFGSVKGRDHSEDGAVDRMTMLEWEISLEGVDWIHLAQDRDRWRELVNTVMKLRVP
jgi:hypothetical protein